MSNYPVRLKEWFPIGDKHYIGDLMEVFKCDACGRIPSYKKAYGMSSTPWGYGEVWCSWKCLRSGKKYKMDKRQQRSWNRRYASKIKGYRKMIDDAIDTTPWDFWKHNSL